MTFIHYFDLQNNPFDQTNNTYFADVHKEDICQLILHDLVDGHNPILLTGESGAGKSMLLQRLPALLPPDIVLIKPIDSIMNYLERLKMAIELYNKLNRQAKKLLLIVDDAQNVSDGELTALLSFSFQYKNAEQSLQMIWCGTQALENKLNQIHPSTFNGLYPNHYRLAGLNEEQVKNYVDDYLKSAHTSVNESPNIFSSAAIHEITRLSKGLPRLINQLCNTSLALAFLDQQKQVNGQAVQEAGNFCLFRRDMLRKIAGQLATITPNDILRTSPNKFSLTYCKRLLNFCKYNLLSNTATFKPAALPGKPLWLTKSPSVYAGVVVSALGLILLFNYINFYEKKPSPDSTENPSTFIESLPATSAGNTVAPLAETPVAEKAPGHEPSPVADKPVMAATTPPSNTMEASTPTPAEKIAPPIKQVVAAKTAQPLPAKESETKSKPNIKVAAAELRNFVRKSNDSRAMVKQLIRHEPKQAVNKPHTLAVNHHKKPNDAKPEFVLMPLDAPGKWDEIIMLDDPKAVKDSPTVTKDSPPTKATAAQIVELPPTETVIEDTKSNSRKKHPQKTKFVLKPLDAPGKWDDIVIVDDVKVTPKENAGIIVEKQKTGKSNEKDTALHLDKSNYQFVSQPVNGAAPPQK